MLLSGLWGCESGPGRAAGVLLLRDCRQLDPLLSKKTASRRTWSLCAAARNWCALRDTHTKKGGYRQVNWLIWYGMITADIRKDDSSPYQQMWHNNAVLFPCPLRRELCLTVIGILKRGVSTLLSRTPPSSWSTFTSALSSPAEAEAEAEASSWLFPSRCTELSAPMANNYNQGELFSSFLASVSLKPSAPDATRTVCLC